MPAFDRIAGATGEVSGDDRLYTVGGCTLTVRVANNQIRSIRTAVGEGCNPLVAGRRLQGQTVGAAARPSGAGVWSSDCLTACGNAADPEHYFQSGGSTGTQNRVVRLASTGLEDGAQDGRLALVARMTARRDEAYVVDGGWRCQAAWQPDLESLIAPLPVTSVTIGFAEDLPLDCAAGSAR